MTYISVYDATTGVRQTSYAEGVQAETVDDLKALAKKEYPDAVIVEETEDQWRTMLDNELIYKNGSYQTKPAPTEEEVKASKRAALTAEYNADVDQLSESLKIAELTGDADTVAEIKAEFADLQASYKEEMEALA